jgi:hypothetical protein
MQRGNKVERRSMNANSPDPKPITPIYTTSVPNEDIILYTGDVDLEQKSKRSTGRGILSLMWLPLGGLNISIEIQGATPIELEPAKAHLLGIPASADIDVTGTRFEQKAGKARTHIKGVVTDKVLFGQLDDLRYIRFHLANFPAVYGANATYNRRVGNATERWERIVMDDEEWKITLDPIAGIYDFEKSLKTTRGFGITWVGQLERKDEKLFKADQSLEVFDALNYVLSFACGRWCPAILKAGYDANENKCWESWSSHLPQKWRHLSGWFDTMHATSLGRLFPGFVKKWRAADWRGALEDAIGWYVYSSRLDAGLDASIALAQMALEMLTWLYFVEDSPIVSDGGFERLPAGDKIKLLLSALSIPINLGSELPELQRFGLANNLRGPDCVSEIRNAIVHRNKKKRLKSSAMPDKAIVEAWTLGIWYIEMVLLKVCGYSGVYSNRLNPRFVGQVERVPWDA